MIPGWAVRFERAFEKEFKSFMEAVQIELVAHAEVLERMGPALGRPLVDTLRGSAYPSMKELRFTAAGGVWRVAFAFDPESRAVLLLAGDKVGLWGRDEQAFYDRLIRAADSRFAAYLKRAESADAKPRAKAAPRTARAGRARRPATR